MDSQSVRRLDRGAGFTLLEVLVAIVILSVGIMAWALAQNQHIQGRALSGGLTKATELTQSVLEANATEVAGWDASRSSTNGTVQYTFANLTFTTFWEVIEGSAPFGSANLSTWQVHCETTWTQYGEHRVAMERLVVGQ
ncbi:type IV pilus modification PilV family protein [Desulfohalobium retbaense]|uniref:Prepilin-type N-terminal cleavage/methylation domain-containing protein n=1 Tax=Desulfohalobium retbaense (strain ATCC 49708 / DSM 5692 / JCM 16813 / HR100) TaxID=485915 RepID=C8X3I4_DESRD|nr:prepilin-type N-terminal cleavage/methylation domain-containing protein [Desulfohalobium retbaense]ACV68981.1 conserved hypothetical protein [Desulfohalobium retbaense DSM 5692]